MRRNGNITYSEGIRRATRMIFILSSLMIFSCEREVKNFRFIENKPGLVVNGILNADSIIKLNITRSLWILDDDQYAPVTGADVEVTVNQSPAGAVINSDTGFYFIDIPVRETNTYGFKVNWGDLPECSAEVIIPEKPVIDTVRYLGHSVEGFKFGITITDQPETDNWYIVNVLSADGYNEYDSLGIVTDTIITDVRKLYLTTNDISARLSLGDDYMPYDTDSDEPLSGPKILFSDDLFDGNAHTIEIECSNFNFNVRNSIPLVFAVESVDENMFMWAMSMDNYSRSHDNPFAEKAWVYTNVEGGYGLIYGKAVAVDSLYLPVNFYDL